MGYAAPAHRPGHAARKATAVQLPPHYASMVRRMDSHTFQIVGLPCDLDPAPFKHRDQAERWLADRLPVLQKRLKRGPRPCLCCGREMISDGPHHRMCDTCRQGDACAA